MLFTNGLFSLGAFPFWIGEINGMDEVPIEDFSFSNRPQGNSMHCLPV
jgi:hypothetical protein